MKIHKNIIYVLKSILLVLPLGGVSGGLLSCSNIAEDERLQFTEQTVMNDTTDLTGQLMSYQPTVLVEDFTGQKCTWCPEGTRLLAEEMETYGEDKVIPVAIHSGGLGVRSTSKIVGLMTDLGEYYWNSNGFSDLTAQPTAVFNRHVTSADRPTWKATIANELQGTRNVAIRCVEAKRQGSDINLKLKFQSKTAVNGHLQLWLLESGIVAMQIDGGTTNKEYVHNHVLREALNGNDGEACSLSNTVVEKDYTYTIDSSKYKPENCYVVAFVYDGTGVLQAAKIDFTEE